MSWKAKLTATEPNPNKPMMSPGRKAGKAITQAIELPAAQVRAKAICTRERSQRQTFDSKFRSCQTHSSHKPRCDAG